MSEDEFDDVGDTCERCGDPLLPDVYGWCANCGEMEKEAVEAFYSWGGWRRAFSEEP